MPGRDGTGPTGRGSMSGGGFGNCAGGRAGGQGFGRGAGQGGIGRGMRRMFQAGGRFGFNAPNQESANQESHVALENRQLMKQNETLRMELDAIMKRLDEMEARTAGSK